MIYKFIDKTEISVHLEIQLKENNLEIFSVNHTKKNCVIISLDKHDLFKLIGALHCIQKEMK
ncbi:hypothetical protein UFOVP206_53 [uncultured Caudovirales phage]|uniref:Uncharacterized protein n=1 Tax=uncultured Caudovirales phage TaxID=2100421 RepID=A0A6J7WK27_9CAUD|nr:hypothetical protein UFOVP206_53 [uncultured Caudovirales phage]